MALSRRGYRSELNVWPGWVDALSTLTIVVVFVLMVFVVAQAFLQQMLAGRDRSLAELTLRVSELNEMLGKERAANAQIPTLQSNLLSITAERDQALASANASVAQVQALADQVSELRSQLQSLNEALGSANAKTEQQNTTIAELTDKLNKTLAERVTELARYRSEFFGRLRTVLGDRQDIRIVGDRFVFQSEVLFPSASATLQAGGKEQLSKLAFTLKDISKSIPNTLNWVLMVEGHTDKRPIATPDFPNNWVLSLARARAVVQFLIEQGIPAQRLAASGYAEYQPVDKGDSEAALARNRRIELKFDQR